MDLNSNISGGSSRAWEEVDQLDQTSSIANEEIVMVTSSDKVIVDLDEVGPDFTELPPEKVLCKVCGKVFRNPHATTCCRSTNCRKCLDSFSGKPCPRCSEAEWDFEVDRDSQRLVNELYVRCLHVSDGCLWFGHLEQLPQHTKSCIFIKVDCPHGCGNRCTRKVLEEHATNRCPKRPYTCDHCGEVDGVYGEIEAHHFPVCPQYPVPCPNKCPEKTVPRSSLENHVKNTCEYQNNVPCNFSFAGCNAKFQRKMIIPHLEKNIGLHMQMMSSAFVEYKEEVDKKMEALPSLIASITPPEPDKNEIDTNIEEILASKDAEIRQLKKEIQELRREKNEQNADLQKVIEKTRHSLALQEHRLSLAEQQNHALTQNLSILRQFLPNPLPITFTINKFDQLRQSNKWWYSRPFYSHIAGYKFGMFVFCNGVLDGKGTHISVFLYLVRGEYDADLDWPFQGSVVIHLINQRADRQHFQKVIRFTEDTPIAVSSRVMESEMAKEGNGPTQFISQADLTYNQQKDTEYVRDDCLKIRVTSINIKTDSVPRTPTATNSGTTGSSRLSRVKSQSVDVGELRMNGMGDSNPSSPVHQSQSPPVPSSPTTSSQALLEKNKSIDSTTS